MMPTPSTDALQSYLRRLCDEAVPQEDRVLLQRFVMSQDREAFEMLVARHGPMVLGTARRQVDNVHDAEDIFQAVFLSLARLAKSIRDGRTLPAWLHRATLRIAARLRKNRTTRLPERVPEPCDSNDPESDLAWREVRQALDEELQRLTERLRSPLVLCYLSGLTREEAASQLGWSLGTLKRRLEQGRQALRTRLERRGLASLGLALAIMSPESLKAAVSKSLIESVLNITAATGVAAISKVSVLALGSTTSSKGLAMKSVLTAIAMMALGLGIYASTSEADPPVKEKGPDVKPSERVAQTDPLPAGSTLRFGTFRFRQGVRIAAMAVSSDGKTAVVANGSHWMGSSRVFDLASGLERTSLDREDRHQSHIEAVAISPNGKIIATKQDMRELCVCLRDAETGREIRKISLPPAGSRNVNEMLAFTPDGKGIVATSRGETLHLVDVESGDMIRNFHHDGTVFALAFSQDGKVLATAASEDELLLPFTRIWDLETGKEIRRLRHGPRGYARCLAFSPDGKTLACGGDDARLRIVDMDSGLERFPLPKDGYRIHSVAFTPEGGMVAAAGDSIRLYDTILGKERLCIPQRAIGIQFTDGGKTLTGAVKGAIHRWDAASGKPLTPEAAGESIVEQILTTSDGKRVITRGQDGDAHIWDGTTGTHLRAIKVAWQRGLAMSPEGRYLVWPITDESIRFTLPQSPSIVRGGSRIQRYDIAADKIVECSPGFKGDAHDLTFLEEGKRLVTVDHDDGMVRFWNVETVKEERQFQAVPEAEKLQHHHVWKSLVSPDGKTLAVAYDQVESGVGFGGGGPHLVRLWDMATGKERHVLQGHLHYVLDLAFSPDGQLLVSAGEKTSDTNRMDSPPKSIDQVFVWDVASGRRVAGLPHGLPIGAGAVAFSRDGNYLAAAIPEGGIQLWEVATWTPVTTFKGHRDRATTLTFSPDGRLLSGSLDTTVLAWNIQPPKHSTGTLETAWRSLASREGAEAFQAQGRFLSEPSEALRFLTERIKPVPACDAAHVQQLILDLDSPEFKVRESASRSLVEHGESVTLALQNSLTTTSSPEIQRRVARILDGFKTVTAERLRQQRAVAILGMFGGTEAHALLKAWSSGAKGATLTEHAQIVLQRLQESKS